MIDAPLIKSYNGAHYFVVPHGSAVGDLCNNCDKLNDDDCTPHTQNLPPKHQCGKAPVVYIRATAQGMANYAARRMK